MSRALSAADSRSSPRAAAERWVDLGRVGDVVAMGRAFGRGEERRGVEVADAERVEIGYERRRPVEVHAVPELEAVGGGGQLHAPAM
jgi:hypothetical protein